MLKGAAQKKVKHTKRDIPILSTCSTKQFDQHMFQTMLRYSQSLFLLLNIRLQRTIRAISLDLNNYQQLIFHTTTHMLVTAQKLTASSWVNLLKLKILN